eukprot:Tamp_07179.p1 GENE.Tamp_07179~~Tamp_07179.p1  ORF type:complete len:664 (-),score=63.03 Tamp_07179:232-2223(-)
MPRSTQSAGKRPLHDDDLEDEAQERESLVLHMPPPMRADECPERGASDKGLDLTIMQQLSEIIHIAVPTALGNLSEFLPITFAMAMVGQLSAGDGGLQLDALAMANSYWNVTGLAVQYGLNSAMRTLAPQAVGSGRSRELSGIHVQRGAVIALVALIPSILLALRADAVLVAAGQPPDLAAAAKEYVLLAQPALAGIALMAILQRVLQAEGHIMANFYISLLVFIAAPALQYLLIRYLGLGLRGAGYAFSIYNCLYLLLMVPYMISADLGHVFVPRLETFHPAGMWAHLSLAIPGLICQLLEWASMELVSIVAGTRISARQLIGALGLCLNLEAIFCMFAVGFMVAVSIKVGHAVGAADAHGARQVAYLGIFAAFAWSLMISTLLYALRAPVISLYTTDDAIARVAHSLFGPLGALITLQALNCTTQGVLTGAGLQRYTATCNLVGWYIVGVPLALSLIWGLNLDLEAGYVLLMSCCAAMLTSWLGQILLLSRHDWAESIQDCQRLMSEAIEAEDLQASCAASTTSSRHTRDGPPAQSHLTSLNITRAITQTSEQRPRAWSNAHSFLSEQRSRGISIAQSASAYSLLSGVDSQRSHRQNLAPDLSSSPFVLQSPHIHSLTFIVPSVPSHRQYLDAASASQCVAQPDTPQTGVTTGSDGRWSAD